MNKNIGVLGTGKTGGEILKILQKRGDLNVIAINQKNPPTEALWTSLDAAICFLPGPAFLQYLDMFLRVPKPMVIGSTGYSLNELQTRAIAELPCSWVMSSNFSIGMSLAKLVLTQMSQWAGDSQLPIKQSLSETHHVHKKDAPSGTALLWKRWIESTNPNAGSITDIESVRVEDECGRHEYHLQLPQETMTFSHDATSRAVFAEGAAWSLDQLLQKSTLPYGRVDFFDLIAVSFTKTHQKAGI